MHPGNGGLLDARRDAWHGMGPASGSVMQPKQPSTFGTKLDRVSDLENKYFPAVPLDWYLKRAGREWAETGGRENETKSHSLEIQ